MRVETKFSPGDRVFFMKSNRIECALVTEIIISITIESVNIAITVKDPDSQGKTLPPRPQDNFFATKAELLSYL